MLRPVVLLVVVTILLSLLPSGATVSDRPLVPTVSVRLGSGANIPRPTVGSPPPVSWSTYLFNPERTGANLAERTIAPSNVSHLQQRWTIPTNGSDFSSPIVVNDTLYFGSWNGYEYAVNAATGQIDWSTFLGTDNNGCGSIPMGITSTPQYVNGTLYLGGGDGSWYALNATTGNVDWSFFVGAPPAENNYDWASALVYDNYLYIGVSSCHDNPLIRGGLIQVNLTGNHTANHTFWTVPAGQVGDSIWTTPAVDPSANTLWVSTGNQNTGYPPYANALIALNATNLNVIGSWQVPNVDISTDSDFGTTPTLFQSPSGMPIVVLTNKDGIAYAFNRSNVTSNGSWGPIWTLYTGGGLSSGTFEGNTLYLAGYGLYAVDPENGSVLWENTTANFSATLSPLTCANGIVYIGSSQTDLIYAVSAKNGSTLWSSAVPGVGIVAAESVVDDGQLYVPSGNYTTEGNLTAYGLLFGGTASTNHTNGTIGGSVSFQAQATGGLTPYYFQWAYGDGGIGSGPDPSHTYTTGGNYTVVAWINDSAGRSIVQSLHVEVIVQVIPELVASVGVSYVNATDVCAGSSVQPVGPIQVRLAANQSGGVPPYTDRWSFSNGGTATGSVVLRNFTAAFIANLTVTDSARGSKNLTQSVPSPTISVPSCPPPPAIGVDWMLWIGIAVAAVLWVIAIVVAWRYRRRPPQPNPPPAKDSS
ncbi:MAG: PQQ-binding-like beta-propeller repeat protein [Thermoplasmata archaeon]